MGNPKKRARKFIKLLSQRINDDNGNQIEYDTGQMKSLLTEALSGLPDSDLKNEINNNKVKYTQQLKLILSGNTESSKDSSGSSSSEFPFNTYTGSVCTVLGTDRLTDNLYIKKELQTQDVDTVIKVLENTSDEHLGLRLLNITCGEESLAILNKIMHIYFQKCQPVIEKCLEKGSLKRCKCFASEVRNFLNVCHLRHCKTEEVSTDVVVPSYKDLVASLCALYVDLLVVTKRGSDKTPITAKKLCSFCCYLTAGMPEYQLDILLQLSAVKTSDVDIMQPFVSKCLSLRPNRNHRYYLKYILALKQYKWALSDQAFQDFRKVAAPKHFLQWLRRRNPSVLDNIPEDKKFKKRQITNFLLEESSEETDNLLMDILTLQSSREKDKTSETEMQEVPTRSAPVDNSSTWTLDTGLEQAKENLFFIDTKGEKKTQESDSVKEEKNNTVEIDLTKNDEDDSGDDVTFLWEETLELEEEEEEVWSDQDMDGDEEEDNNADESESKVVTLLEEVKGVIQGAEENKVPLATEQRKSPKTPEKGNNENENGSETNSVETTEVFDFTKFSATSSDSKDEAQRIRERLFDDLIQKEQQDEKGSDPESEVATIEGMEIISDSVDSDEENILSESLVLPNLSSDNINSSFSQSESGNMSPTDSKSSKLSKLKHVNSEQAVSSVDVVSSSVTNSNQTVVENSPIATRSSKRQTVSTAKPSQNLKSPVMNRSSKKSSKRSIVDPQQTLLPSAPKAQKIFPSETSVGVENKDVPVADTSGTVQTPSRRTQQKSSPTTPKSSKKIERNNDTDQTGKNLSHETNSKHKDKSASLTPAKKHDKENLSKTPKKSAAKQNSNPVDNVVLKSEDISKYFLRRRRETSESSVTLDNSETPTKTNKSDVTTPSKAVISAQIIEDSDDDEITFKAVEVQEDKPPSTKKRKSLPAKENSAKSSSRRYSLRKQHE